MGLAAMGLAAGRSAGDSSAGPRARYPACLTAAIRSPASNVAGKLTVAVSVARLTVAVTPSSLVSCFSTRATHEAQVMPSIASSIRVTRTKVPYPPRVYSEVVAGGSGRGTQGAGTRKIRSCRARVA